MKAQPAPRQHVRKRRAAFSLLAIRLRELRAIIASRNPSGITKESPASRALIRVFCHHLMQLPRNPAKTIPAFLKETAPWLTLSHAQAMQDEAMTKPRSWKADTLGWMLHLSNAEREHLGIRTIGAFDVAKAQRTKRRKDRNRQAKEAARRKAGAMSRADYLTTLAKIRAKPKPWTIAGISRAKWYRQHRETP